MLYDLALASGSGTILSVLAWFLGLQATAATIIFFVAAAVVVLIVVWLLDRKA